jgi:hypothetical protein
MFFVFGGKIINIGDSSYKPTPAFRLGLWSRYPRKNGLKPVIDQ